MKALWTPSESFIKKTNIFKFQKFLEKDIKKKFTNYEKLWKWSTDNKEIFWLKLSEYLNITVHKKKILLVIRIIKILLIAYFLIILKLITIMKLINYIRIVSL